MLRYRFYNNKTYCVKIFVTRFTNFERDEEKISRHIQRICREIFSKS